MPLIFRNLILIAALFVSKTDATAFVHTCWNGTDAAPFVVEDLDNANDPASTTVDYIVREAPLVNAGTVSVSPTEYVPSKSTFVAVGFNRVGDGNSILVMDVSDPEKPVVVNECRSPGSTDVHCVAYVRDNLYVVFGSTFSNGTVARLDPVDCSWATLTESPARVSGSYGGPGGRCVGLHETQQMAWLADDARSDGPGIILMDTAMSPFSTTMVTQNISDRWADSQGELAFDATSNSLFWYAGDTRNGPARLLQFDTQTLQETDRSDLLPSDMFFLPWELFFDSERTRFLAISDESIVSIPLNGDDLVTIRQRPNPTSCGDFGGLVYYPILASDVSFPTAAPTQAPSISPTSSPSNYPTSPKPTLSASPSDTPVATPTATPTTVTEAPVSTSGVAGSTTKTVCAALFHMIALFM